MSIKTIFFKSLEYTPIGIVSGIIRFRASTASASDKKAYKTGVNCLNINRENSNYSPAKERLRAIISSIPILNILVLAPVDIFTAVFGKKYHKVPLPEEEVPDISIRANEVMSKPFERAKKALGTLAKYYEVDDFDEIDNGNKDIIIAAFKDARNSFAVLQEKKLKDVIREGEPIFTPGQFLENLEICVNVLKSRAKVVDVLSHSENLNGDEQMAAMYIKNFHKEAIEFLNAKLRNDF